jgi:hypothetical protein
VAAAVAGAAVSFGRFATVTNFMGEAVLNIPATTYPVRATSRNYSQYVSALTLAAEGTIYIDMVPLVRML